MDERDRDPWKRDDGLDLAFGILMALLIEACVVLLVIGVLWLLGR